MRSFRAELPESRYIRTIPRNRCGRRRSSGPKHHPAILTLGGVGGGITFRQELREIAGRGIDMSPVHEVLLEESVIGWKEFELEVMRDRADNFVVICSIENSIRWVCIPATASRSPPRSR